MREQGPHIFRVLLKVVSQQPLGFGVGVGSSAWGYKSGRLISEALIVGPSLALGAEE